MTSSSAPEEQIGDLDEATAGSLLHDWRRWARPEQLSPPGNWVTWLLLGGRGSGKTRAGAEWIRAMATGPRPVSPLALVGETISEAIAVMVEGDSGLLRVHPPHETPALRGHTLRWPNGAEATVLSASDPDRFRGPQFAAAWCDEVAKWPDAEAAWDMLQFALRLGDRPRQVATTTPRPVKLLRRLLADPLTAVSRMKTGDNRHLAPGFLDAVVGRYRGTLLGRQELDGELIEDRPDALWNRALFKPAPQAFETRRTVVAIDPPVSGGPRADACGIIVAAALEQGAVVIEDCSLRPAPPLRWAERAVGAFHRHNADAIVAEVNQGGDLVKQVIAQVDPDVPVIAVRATRGKWLRAEPVAALYARGLVLHCAGLAGLEDEMCAFDAGGRANGHSPDRVDALVWALTELLLTHAAPRVRGL